MEKKVEPERLAMHLPIRVLPVPGGPKSILAVFRMVSGDVKTRQDFGTSVYKGWEGGGQVRRRC